MLFRSKTAESGRLARLAYTYLHMPIVAGIILTAVADELVLKHPNGHSDVRTIVSTIGGPLVFLVGTVLFKHAIRGFLQLSHGIGIILLLVLWWFAADLSPLWLSVATSVIMIVVAVWESVSLGSKPEEPDRAPARHQLLVPSGREHPHREQLQIQPRALCRAGARRRLARARELDGCGEDVFCACVGGGGVASKTASAAHLSRRPPSAGSSG